MTAASCSSVFATISTQLTAPQEAQGGAEGAAGTPKRGRGGGGRRAGACNTLFHALSSMSHHANTLSRRKRKAALEALLARQKEDEVAEDALLEQAKVIEAKRKAEASARRPPPAGMCCLTHLGIWIMPGATCSGLKDAMAISAKGKAELARLLPAAHQCVVNTHSRCPLSLPRKCASICFGAQQLCRRASTRRTRAKPCSEQATDCHTCRPLKVSANLLQASYLLAPYPVLAVYCELFPYNLLQRRC